MSVSVHHIDEPDLAIQDNFHLQSLACSWCETRLEKDCRRGKPAINAPSLHTIQFRLSQCDNMQASRNVSKVTSLHKTFRTAPLFQCLHSLTRSLKLFGCLGP
ncbi:hypothetical protein ILYODFUR_010099 [Ilyodon furcidens]|uniref:Uncharacterized protein n=1 Tax=Ilyodon furcidens TaxID=33524 RepID=A0ABV0UTL2_9TELE